MKRKMTPGEVFVHIRFNIAPQDIEGSQRESLRSSCLVWTAPARPAVRADRDFFFFMVISFALLTVDIVKHFDICFIAV